MTQLQSAGTIACGKSRFCCKLSHSSRIHAHLIKWCYGLGVPAAMQQKISVPILIVVQLFLWYALDNIAAQTSCNPPCVAGKEQCQQVLNANGQYACVTIVSPSIAAISPTATSNLSPVDVPAGCRSCSGGQTCEQVFNGDQYHCVDKSAAKSPTTSTSPAASPIPAGCQDCSPSQLCQQVYNSNQYHCVENASAVAAPTPSTSADFSNNSSGSVSNFSCNPACSNNETCKQVFNSKQYACQPKEGTMSSTPAATAPVTPDLADPALSDQAASPSTSNAGLSGESI